MEELKLIGRYVRTHWLRYLLGITALAGVDLMNVYIPQFTGQITDGLRAGTMTMDGVWRLVGLILLMGLGMAVGRFGWRFFIFGTGLTIRRDLQEDLFAHLEKLSMRYFNEHKTGDLMAHFTNDMRAVQMLLGPTVVTAFDASVMLVMVLWKMVRYVNLKLTLVAAEIAEAIADQFPDTDLAVLEAVCQRHLDIDAWNETPVMAEASLERLQDVMETAGELAQRVAFADLVDNRFAEAAK